MFNDKNIWIAKKPQFDLTDSNKSNKLIVQDAVIKPADGKCYLPILNAASTKSKINPNTYIPSFEQIEEIYDSNYILENDEILDEIGQKLIPMPEVKTKKLEGVEREQELYDRLSKVIGPNLNDSELRKLQDLLSQYTDIFALGEYELT